MATQTKLIQSTLPNGTSFYIQARDLDQPAPSPVVLPPGLEEDIAFRPFPSRKTEHAHDGTAAGTIEHSSFDQVTQSIEGIGQALAAAWNTIKPSKATVELNLELGWKSGVLTTLLVDATATASMKVTLEWQNDPAASDPAPEATRKAVPTQEVQVP